MIIPYKNDVVREAEARKLKARGWVPWFAWYPVKVAESRLAWLERVDFRVYDFGYCAYDGRFVVRYEYRSRDWNPERTAGAGDSHQKS